MNSQNSTVTERNPGRDSLTRMAAEWEPQDVVLLAWPHARTDWREQLHQIDACYVRLTAAIARFQPVLICVADKILEQHVSVLLAAAKVDQSMIRFAVLPYNDTWIRDYGPIGVATSRGPRLLDFRFNGWGGRFAAELDNQVTTRLHAQGFLADHPIRRIPWELEGGAIDGNGQGVLLTTVRCLCNPNRNKPTDRGTIETLLLDLLGAHTVLWLDHGELEGDDTDGHVDQLARFCDPGTIAYCADDGKDVQARSLQHMAQQLQTFRQANGKPYRLVPLPVPQPIVNKNGQRLPASYVNFLILNGAVLVPGYGDRNDAIACERLQTCFPDRAIEQIPARALIEQGGSLHCATMHLPVNKLNAIAGTMRG